MPDECHIASMIVQVQPAGGETLMVLIANEPGLELHAHSPEGKMVLVMESPSRQEILATIDQIEQQPGVLSCTLVYQEVLQAGESDQILIPQGQQKASPV